MIKPVAGRLARFTLNRLEFRANLSPHARCDAARRQRGVTPLKNASALLDKGHGCATGTWSTFLGRRRPSLTMGRFLRPWIHLGGVRNFSERLGSRQTNPQSATVATSSR